MRHAASELSAIIPRASLTRLDDCGHDIANERPDKLAALLLDHVAQES